MAEELILKAKTKKYVSPKTLARRKENRRLRKLCTVYAIRAFEGGPVYYVGQTRVALEVRLKNHYRELRRSQYRGYMTRFQRWLDSLDFHPHISILAEKAQWDIAEAVWIDRLLRDGHPLTNVSSVVPEAA